MMGRVRRTMAAGMTRLLELGRARGWRLPFTTSLLATMLVANATGGSLTHSITEEALLGRVGYGLDTLQAGRLDTLITNIPFALYPWMLATITFLVLIGVAPFELVAGWRRTALVFFAAQIGGYLLASLLVAWPLAALGSGWGHSLATARDVGPSAGAFGCLAASFLASDFCGPLSVLFIRRQHAADGASAQPFFARNLAVHQRGKAAQFAALRL